MKVTVIKPLNVRVGAPSVNAPCYQYLVPGSQIEVEDQVYKGDTYDDSNIWLKDLANNYYWRGAVEVPPAQKNISPVNIKSSDCWWINDYGIVDLWNQGLTGKGIKIAVLDSGLAIPHPDLDLNKSNLADFSQSPSGILDQMGHGTHVSGIIKATKNDIGITGLAYNSDFYFGKITNDIRGDKLTFLVKAINWAIQQKVDIISISQGYGNDSAELSAAIKSACDDNILVVCAAGNKDDTTGSDILFPARYETTLSIGGVTEKDTPLSDTINIAQINLFAPGENILSTYLDSKYSELSGSSQAAPFVAGVACLILEKKRKADPAFKASVLKNELIQHATSTAYGKKINPTNI